MPKPLSFRGGWLAFALAIAMACAVTSLRASDAEQIGLNAMRRERPAVTGAGVPVAQPEGEVAPDAWEANPILNPAIFFTWTSASGTATNFPNLVGIESGHADGVGAQLYGAGSGVAPGIPQVDSYEAGYFISNIVQLNAPMTARVVNQSFILGVNELADIEYDTYASLHNVLFVSGMNNAPDTPPSPGSAYNGIGVGVFTPNTTSSIGPTSDGRAKPDLVAPHSCCTSFSTPLVAGGAALLLQAAAANDGGAGTASVATNSVTVKALLLNGAVKTTNWTNGVTRPLDARHGAGVLNVYNSDLQLRGGRRTPIATNNVDAGTPHPPTSATNNIPSLRGWDFGTIQSTIPSDRVAHYYFVLPGSSAVYSHTATLVWGKGAGPLANLDLFLYDVQSTGLVAQSTSTVDNVEHLFIPNLPAGRYDLQVLKHGGFEGIGSEEYALAFDFSPVKLSLARSATNVVLAWPASPAGFVLQSAASLNAPIDWQDVPNESVLSNSMNTVALPASSAMQLFRLFRP